ncbi:UNVERIFIED_CONTAM: hypothetical protein K2H54_045247 [Gekko kuhli]
MEDEIDENTLVGGMSVEQFLRILKEGIQKGIEQVFASFHDPQLGTESIGKLEQCVQNSVEISMDQQEKENTEMLYWPIQRLNKKSTKVNFLKRKSIKRKLKVCKLE